MKAHLAFVRKHRSPAEHLAATIALEHFTAILADTLLSDERILGNSDSRLAAVWRWHAIEETEHKAVAYDVFHEVLGDTRRAYALRVVIMLVTTIDFWLRVFRSHFALVRADGALLDVGGWWKLFRFLWSSPGGMRKLALPLLDYFRRDFHPWQHDNFHYVRSCRAQG